MLIKFTKMHGNGNDFIIIDEIKETIIPHEKKSEFAKNYCNRKFGIGADGILFLSKPEIDGVIAKMQLYQPDGSKAPMCGNGIRCLAKYLFDTGSVKMNSFNIQTEAGIRSVHIECNNDREYKISVNMGKAVFGKGKSIAGISIESVNTGVPHAVVFVESVEDVDVNIIASKIRNDSAYPKDINVDFVQITSNDEITIRTYESGVEGETLSCGTGATASALAASAKKLVFGDIIHVITSGGLFDITVNGKTPIMTGPAETVYTGEIILPDIII